MTNLYYVKSERYSGEDALAIVAKDIDEAIVKYRKEKKERWEAWKEDFPEEAKDDEGPDLTIGNVNLECEIDVP